MAHELRCASSLNWTSGFCSVVGMKLDHWPVLFPMGPELPMVPSLEGFVRIGSCFHVHLQEHLGNVVYPYAQNQVNS